MSLHYLLDTGVISSPIAKQPNPAIITKLEANSAECAISAPVWHELVFGCQRLPAGKRRRAIEAYLEDVVRASFPILPYDEVAAAWHARERARLEALGRPAPFVDGQIAAIAISNQLVLVTGNIRDFARYRGLDAEDWSTGK